jgi:hypothetical protein
VTVSGSFAWSAAGVSLAGSGLWLVGLETAVGVQLPRRIRPSRFGWLKICTVAVWLARRRHQGLHNADFIVATTSGS